MNRVHKRSSKRKIFHCHKLNAYRRAFYCIAADVTRYCMQCVERFKDELGSHINFVASVAPGGGYSPGLLKYDLGRDMPLRLEK